MKQFIVTPSAGKRLIAVALAKNPAVLGALEKRTLVIIAGTTNGYVTEEVFKHLGIDGFSRAHFFRGITLPPGGAVTEEGRLADESEFPGDVVITDGVWQKGKTIGDVVDTLKEGDVILKGANALDMEHKQAAVLIGHPKAGTVALAMQAVAGRRVKLIIPVGLEKRVNGDLYALTEKLNSPDASGYRMFLAPGQVFTEIEDIQQLAEYTVQKEVAYLRSPEQKHKKKTHKNSGKPSHPNHHFSFDGYAFIYRRLHKIGAVTIKENNNPSLINEIKWKH